ncbi:MAG: Rv1355c family protein [Polyangiales bacterium]
MHSEGVGPAIFSAADDRNQVRELAATASVHDTLRQQLAELIETRTPDRKLGEPELKARVDALLGSDPDGYGNWVHYPWSNRLVRVLPAATFAELRSSRNRNKITAAEQARLSGTTLGVAGLSVGQATAVTLALEGLGGTLRLADFDTLSLSNLNRLRAGVHELGVNPAVIPARAIWEFNPYCQIELFERGVDASNVGAFLEGLDLLFEECDDLKMKVMLREEARRRRIPVLMETSDRGLLDIERFDREPNRPLFHGLAGELQAERLSGLSNYEKVPVVLAILGASTMSPRLASSLVDVEVSLRTWPQLASAVALGGAVNTDTARRILLDQLHASGRYFVDLDDIVSNTPPPVTRIATPTEPAPPRQREPRARPALRGALTRDQLDDVVRAASLAPSGGNAQRWRFVYDERSSTLACLAVPERAASYLDFERRATHLAFGAVAENLRLVGAQLGHAVTLASFPYASQPELVCTAQFGPPDSAPPSADDAQLARWIDQRVTNRRIGTRKPLPAESARALQAAAGEPGALTLLVDPAQLAAFGALHGESERLRTLHPVMHPDLLAELRWSRAEAERTRDGIELATLELTPTDLAGMSVLRRRDVVATMRGIDVGQGLTRGSHKAMSGACALGVLRARGSDPRAYFEAGMRMQRLWLRANAEGLALQPMTALLYVFARLDAKDGGGLSEPDRTSFAGVRAAYRELLPPRPGMSDVFAFRLTSAEPPSARALRLPVEAVLDIAR